MNDAQWEREFGTRIDAAKAEALGRRQASSATTTEKWNAVAAFLIALGRLATLIVWGPILLGMMLLGLLFVGGCLCALGGAMPH